MDVAKGEVVMQKPQERSGDTARRFTFDAVYDWTYVPLDRDSAAPAGRVHWSCAVDLSPSPLLSTLQV